MEKQMNVPKLRFSEFSGEWDMKKLGVIFNISAGGDIGSENVSQIKTDEFKYPIYANAEKNKGFYGYSNIYKIDENVVTVAGRGVNLGIAHARDHKFYPIVRLLVLKPKKNENIYFFEYQINQLNLFKESTGVPQLTAPQVSNYEIFYPEINEQTKIANFLTVVDDKLTQLKKKKSLLEQYKKGVMQKLFSQELRFKDENGEDFAEWEEKKLGDYLIKYEEKATENNQYPVLTSSRRGLYFQKDYFNGNDVASKDTTGYNVVPRNFFTYRHMSDDITFKFNKNTICDKGIVSTLYPVFTTKNINEDFLLLKLNEGAEFIKYAGEQKQGGSRTYMYFKKLTQLLIVLPTFPEQTQIANFLSSIDDKINHCGVQIEKMEGWKKGLLQQMFV